MSPWQANVTDTFMFSMEIRVVLWPISQSLERKWRAKHTGAGAWEECVPPLAFRVEPCLLGWAMRDHHPIMRTDAQLRRDLFCSVFIFASPLMTTEGITKLMPHACEILLTAFIVMEDDSSYQSRRNMLEKKSISNTFWETRHLSWPLQLPRSLESGWWQSNQHFLLLEEACLLSLSLGCAEF